MSRILFAILSLLALSAVAQDNVLLRQNMFDDIHVTNAVTKSYRDSSYTFHVKVVEDHESHTLPRRYFWFNQGEVLSTVGNFTGRLLHGPFEKFDRDGKLLEKGNFSNGLKDGTWTTWYANGNILSQRAWSKGWRTGTFTEYYDNGALKRKGKFRGNELHGKVYSYALSGETVGKEKYKHGKLLKAKEKKVKADAPKTINGKDNKVTTDQSVKDDKSVKKTRRKWFSRKPKTSDTEVKKATSTDDKSKPTRKDKKISKKEKSSSKSAASQTNNQQ